MTRQREVILNTIMNAEEHMTAEQVFASVKEVMPKMVLATVYNNLIYLTNCGMIRKISVPDAADRYDRNIVPHGHCVCVKCGKFKDFYMNDMTDILSKSAGKKIESYNLTVKMICDECERKGECDG